MKFSQLILIIVIISAAVVAVFIVKHQTDAVPQAAAESAYDRVIRTGVLRCGYADSPPYNLVKDPQTGKVSGFLPDITEAVAGKLGLKVEWTEDTGWANIPESLRAHRIDAFCAGLWRNASRGRYVRFGAPLHYVAIYPYVAAGDHRFDLDLSLVNDPSVRVSAIDGQISDLIAKTSFPKATEIAVPGTGQVTDIFMNVATHKADIVFYAPATANAFIRANPGSLRMAQDKPLQVFPSCYAMELRESLLQNMLDSAVIELQGQGVIDRIMKKYTGDTKEYLPVAKPYQD